MDILRVVVKKRSEDTTAFKDADLMKNFSTRVAKLRGDGPMSSSDEPEVALEVVSINIREIEVPPNYVRKSTGDIDNLVASIRVYGIQQPLKVVKIKAAAPGSKKYRLVFGRRRLKAAEVAGLDAVPCIVELVTREDRLQMLSLVENLHRSAINPIEEGAAYQQMAGQKASALEEIAQNLGMMKGLVEETMELMSLPTAVHKDILSKPQIFPFEMLRVLLIAFRQSKVHGKKLLAAIASEEVTSPAQAKSYLGSL